MTTNVDVPDSSLEPSGICYASARQLAARLRAGELAATEVMEAFLLRINAVNPRVNAICTLLPEESLLKAAHRADLTRRQGKTLGPLHGLPIAIKDLMPTEGIRTTFGSRLYEHHVPACDGLLVERLKAAGAIIIGKTNTPEYGAGSHTFNDIFGVTRNPYNLDKSAGGSSGGAAAALAAGMLPLADGSDLGGSLRNPAAFCNVVGFRPSPGRVPTWPNSLGWNPLPTTGPMARSVDDVALLLSVLAGPDSRSPIALNDPGILFDRPLAREVRGVRVAWGGDLGRYPVQPGVMAVCERALGVFRTLGCEVESTYPDFEGADEAFQTLRAWEYAFNATENDNYPAQKHLYKDTVVWNIEKGLKLSALDIARAEAKRTQLFQRLQSFLTNYEFLVLPTTQVVPFDVDTEWVREINGNALETYLDWMSICSVITVTGLPAISIPCGFTKEGLPVGLQIIGRHQRDFEVLQMAYAFEQVTQFAKTRPKL